MTQRHPDHWLRTIECTVPHVVVRKGNILCHDRSMHSIANINSWPCRVLKVDAWNSSTPLNLVSRMESWYDKTSFVYTAKKALG